MARSKLGAKDVRLGRQLLFVAIALGLLILESGRPVSSRTATAAGLEKLAAIPVANADPGASLSITSSDSGGQVTQDASTRFEPADPVMVGAGDIASCTSGGDEATAALLDGIAGTVFTLGDNAYPNGTPVEFNTCYAQSWGRHKARTKPAPGNHDYNTAGAIGFYGYFGAAAGDPSRGYYSYELGSWQILVINSNCAAIGGCGTGSPQEQWLRQTLAGSPRTCTLAYWHHPLFTSDSLHAGAASMRPIWQALYEYGADVILSGHAHNYERFAPQDPSGASDPARGVRQFVVGTGGASHREFGTVKPNSEARNADTYGVLKVMLHPTSYEWQFVPEAGKTFSDLGSAACNGASAVQTRPRRTIQGSLGGTPRLTPRR